MGDVCQGPNGQGGRGAEGAGDQAGGPVQDNIQAVKQGRLPPIRAVPHLEGIGKNRDNASFDKHEQMGLVKPADGIGQGT